MRKKRVLSGLSLSCCLLGTVALPAVAGQHYISPSMIALDPPVNSHLKALPGKSIKHRPVGRVTKISGGVVENVHIYNVNGMKFSSDSLTSPNVAVRGIKKSTSIKPKGLFGFNFISTSGYGDLPRKVLSTWSSDGKHYALDHKSGTLTESENGGLLDKLKSTISSDHLDKINVLDIIPQLSPQSTNKHYQAKDDLAYNIHKTVDVGNNYQHQLRKEQSTATVDNQVANEIAAASHVDSPSFEYLGASPRLAPISYHRHYGDDDHIKQDKISVIKPHKVIIKDHNAVSTHQTNSLSSESLSRVEPQKVQTHKTKPTISTTSKKIENRIKEAKKNKLPYVLLEDGSVCFIEDGKTNQCF